LPDSAAASADAASLFILSFRHRDELLAAAGRAGWQAIAARRAAGVERRFIDSAASVAIVDGRGALDEALGAIRMLADPVEANTASLLVLLSRADVTRFTIWRARSTTPSCCRPCASRPAMPSGWAPARSAGPRSAGRKR
jgi:hypothetical protein